MFKKLFGGPGKPAQQAKPTVDPMQTMEKLGNQIENVEKRAKVLENKVNSLKMEAIQKRKGKDNRGIYIIESFRILIHSLFLSYRCSPRNEIDEDVREGTRQDRRHEDITRATEVYD
jgi:hypothetical protein